MGHVKALLVGINAYAEMPLRGCVNDVRLMQATLLRRAPDAEVRVLLDTAATAAAIRDGLRWLVQPDAGPPAARLFHFSGHGTFVADDDGDEPDGCDECLVPYDYATAGYLRDDLLHGTLAAVDTPAVLTIDCCHSGTIQRSADRDILYRFLPIDYGERRRIAAAAERAQHGRDAFVQSQLGQAQGRSVDLDAWQERVRAAMAAYDRQHFGAATVPGNVVLLSACRADQSAADAATRAGYHGAFSYHLVEALRSSPPDICYDDLVAAVGRALAAAGFDQEPQLECSEASRSCGFLAFPA